jgi:hypothetical protein
MAIATENRARKLADERLIRYERQLSQQYARNYKLLRQMQFDLRKAAAQVPDTTEDTNRQNEPKPAAKTGRNELCPCGSTKKFKRCCLNKPNVPGVPSAVSNVSTATGSEEEIDPGAGPSQASENTM